MIGRGARARQGVSRGRPLALRHGGVVARFAEFFAGIGLVREAVEPLGWDCAFANDIAPDKAEMYAARFGREHLLVRDIHGVEVADLPDGLDLLTASFPCIDLSLAGNRAGLAGEHSGTIWPFVQLVRDLRRRRSAPGALLLENVTGFLTSNSGDDLSDVCAEIGGLGYCLDLVVVDARWFVPQSRPRLFVLAVRDDVLAGATPPTGHVSRLRGAAIRRFQVAHRELPFVELPLPEPPSRATRALVSVLEEVSAEDEMWWPRERVAEAMETMATTHRKRVEHLARGIQDGVATMYRRVRRGRTVSEVRGDSIAGCLRTPQGGSSVQFLVDCRGTEPRIRPLTGREYARLQGASDFPILVGRRQAQLGFGDAVCVPAVGWLVDHAFGFLLGKEPCPAGVQLPLAQPLASYAVGH